MSDEPKDLATALVRISNQQFQNDNLRENVRALRAELAGNAETLAAQDEAYAELHKAYDLSRAELAQAKDHLAQACNAAGLGAPEYYTLDELLAALNTLHDEHAFMLTGYSESEIHTMRVELAKEKT